MDNFNDINVDEIRNINTLREVVYNLLEISRRNPYEEANELISNLSQKCIELDDKESLIVIKYIKHILIFGLLKKNGEILLLAEEMYSMSKEIDFKEGLALYNIVLWGVEKLNGKYKEAKAYREKSFEILNNIKKPNPIISHWIKYSYAVGEWTENRNTEAANYLEECLFFFRQEQHFSSEINTATIIADIYSKTNQNEKLFDIVQEIMGNDNLFEYYPKQVLGRFHFLLGKMFLSKHDMLLAEMHIFTSTGLFKRFGYDLNYIYDYLSGLSILARIYATSRKINEVSVIVSELKDIIDNNNLEEKLSRSFVNSLIGSLAITQFYLSFHTKERREISYERDIKNSILRYQGFILLPEMITELLIYSNIKTENLESLKTENISYPFLRRVIDFLYELNNPETLNLTDRMKKASKIMKIEQDKIETSKLEIIFGDLTLAKLYLSVGRYLEFKKIMKKYLFKTEMIHNNSLRYWAKSMEIIHNFLNGERSEKSVEKLTEIVDECESKSMKRIARDVKAFRLMLLQKDISANHSQIFQRLSFLDLILAPVEKV